MKEYNKKGRRIFAIVVVGLLLLSILSVCMSANAGLLKTIAKNSKLGKKVKDVVNKAVNKVTRGSNRDNDGSESTSVRGTLKKVVTKWGNKVTKTVNKFTNTWDTWKNNADEKKGGFPDRFNTWRSNAEERKSSFKDRFGTLSGKRLEKFNGKILETITSFIGKKIDTFRENKNKFTDAFSKLVDSKINIKKSCFLVGTKIRMSDNSLKNIEDIGVGDLVKSYDIKTGEWIPGKVIEVFHHAPEEMTDYYLIINNELRVTPNHPLYVNGEWITADDLKIGDPIGTEKGESIVLVESIEKIYERVNTYNFEVAVYHNYQVIWDSVDTLAHNAQQGYAARKQVVVSGDKNNGGGDLDEPEEDRSTILGDACTYIKSRCNLDEPEEDRSTILGDACTYIKSRCTPTEGILCPTHGFKCITKNDGAFCTPTGLFDPECTPTEGGVLCTYGVMPTVCEGSCPPDDPPDDPPYYPPRSHYNNLPNAEFMYDYHYTREDITEGTIDPQTALTTIQFTDYSIDYDGTIIQWYWDFGDENTGTEQNPMHQYAEIGDYTVTLYVMDNQGMEDSVSHQISLTLPEDETLMIHTYNETVENYEFLVYVSDGYNLIPDATLEFNNENYVTNETGVVNITAPDVDQDAEFTITASKDGYDSGTTTISVRNNKLHVVAYNETGYYTESIPENTLFIVAIYDYYGQTVENTNISFSDQNGYTNENGTITLLAPPVSENTNYIITATKDGYTSNSTMINILNISSNDLPVLQIVTYNESGYPCDTFSECTGFYVAVYSYYGQQQAVENATVTLLNQNKTTDENGTTVLFTPSVDENISYLITATKEGYSPGSMMISVTNIPGYSPPELHVYILDESGYLAENNSVYENTTFTVIVADETDMYGIQNAAVEFNGQTNYTNETGETTFKAPFVNNDKTFDIISFAEGCQINVTLIHILDGLSTDSQSQGIHVYIINNSYSETDSVLENESFYAYVTNELDSPISGVNVMFSPVTNTTFVPQNQISSEEGLVGFTAPVVEYNVIFNVIATKDGLSDSKLLVVIDQPVNTSTTGISHLNETSLMFILAAIIAVAIALLLFFWWRRRKSKKKQQVSTFKEYNNTLSSEEKTNKIKIMKKEVGPPSFELTDKEKPQIGCSSTDYMNKRIDVLIKKRKNIIKN